MSTTAPLPLETPFEHLALAFSGGGFRAAAFCLGVLTYLDRVRFPDPAAATLSAATTPATPGAPTPGAPTAQSSLLQKVRYISSASGGTVTSASFALACAEGTSFQQFYLNLYHKLEQETIVQRALEILNTTKTWQQRPDKNRNLINAFALSYDQLAFDGKTIAALRQKKPGGMNIPLEEVCFNSTEFFLGLPFRQNIKLLPDPLPDPGFRYGNFYYHLDQTAVDKIRLSDALAASSCFPVGFEPFKFPEDLSYPGLSTADLLQGVSTNPALLDQQQISTLQEKGFGLMDGGITDNQGLESLMLADERRYNKETAFAPFDLVLVNDVGSQYMDPYDVPKTNSASLLGRLNFMALQWIFFAGLPLLALLPIWFGWHSIHSQGAGHSTHLWVAALCFAVAGFLLGLTGIFFLVNKQVPTRQPSTGPLHNFSPRVVTLLLHFLKRTFISLIAQMGSARVSSAIILNTDVFMNRIRSLIYNSFYDSPRWDNRRKGNHVYDLSHTNDLNRAQSITPATPAVSPDIQVVAQVAFDVPIELWFAADDNTSQPCLIACGQFNTCYNLLEYTQLLLANPPLLQGLSPDYLKRINDIHAFLLADWEKFRTDPFCQYNETAAQKRAVINGKIGIPGVPS